ncbi:MAG: hypothetical protein NZ518_04150 [Dehalococcoidia bacterium]|nr:hypothetical protein [Dehalococcoidia bacterium]
MSLSGAAPAIRLPRTVSPAAMAWHEAEGWRAYYDRNVPRAFWLMLSLNRTQFGLAPLEAARATIDLTRAFLTFQPAANDLVATRRSLRRYYRRVSAAIGAPRDPALAAQRELEYWIVHRALAGFPDREPLIRTLAELHAVTFGGTPEAMRESAERRAAAVAAVDRITSGRTRDAAADWATVHAELRAAYHAAHRAIAPESAATAHRTSPAS